MCISWVRSCKEVSSTNLRCPSSLNYLNLMDNFTNHVEGTRGQGCKHYLKYGWSQHLPYSGGRNLPRSCHIVKESSTPISYVYPNSHSPSLHLSSSADPHYKFGVVCYGGAMKAKLQGSGTVDEFTPGLHCYRFS